MNRGKNMPYKTHKYKRFESQDAYDRYQAYIHMHNIPHSENEYVEIMKNGKYVLYKPQHNRRSDI
jgi:hypothetical protein